MSCCSQVVEKRIPCPTILTLQGDRVNSRGKFGGAQNRAPPIHKLKVFGAPLPQHYFMLQEQKGDTSYNRFVSFVISHPAPSDWTWSFLFWTELLCQYHAAVMKRQTAEMDWTRHWKSPDMAQKQQKMEEIKKQLEDIDEQLGEDYFAPSHFSVFILNVSDYLVFFSCSISETMETRTWGRRRVVGHQDEKTTTGFLLSFKTATEAFFYFLYFNVKKKN